MEDVYSAQVGQVLDGVLGYGGLYVMVRQSTTCVSVPGGRREEKYVRTLNDHRCLSAKAPMVVGETKPSQVRPSLSLGSPHLSVARQLAGIRNLRLFVHLLLLVFLPEHEGRVAGAQ